MIPEQSQTGTTLTGKPRASGDDPRLNGGRPLPPT